MSNFYKFVPVFKTLVMSASATLIPLFLNNYFTPIIGGITGFCGLILVVYKMLNEIRKYYKKDE